MKNLFLFLFCLFSFVSQAQVGEKDSVTGPVNWGNEGINYDSPKKYVLGPIKIEGADNYDHQAIKLIAGLRPGDEILIPSDKISNAIKNLWKEGLFSSVDITYEKIQSNVIYLVIKLEPRPKISRIKYSGAPRREVDKIREEVKLNSGKTITENLVFTTQSIIRNYYKEKGYNDVHVNIVRIQDTLINNSEIFNIVIDKGEKVKIQEIVIDGAYSVKTGKLKRAMKDTKEHKIWRVIKRSKYNQTAYARDKEAMLDKLRSTGLRDVFLVSDSVYKISDKRLGIYMKIDEGAKYYFGNITWIGNTKYRSGLLDTVLGIKYGDVYNKPLFEQRVFASEDGRNITSLYMDRGYLFFQVNPVETGVNDNHINYEMRIIEGKEARVRNIIISGNQKTNEHVIRREIRTKPGDLFNRNDIMRTQRELAQLGYFNEQGFQVNPIPNPDDGTVDIEYVVEEKSADQIELSGGYGAGRIIGTLGLTFSNFSMRNFFKKGAWTPLPTGDGQRLSIRAQSNGRYYQGYNLSFTEPWMGGKKPNSFSFGINHTSFSNYATSTLKKSDPSYSGVAISGASVGLGRRKKIPDDYFSAYYELAYQYYDVRNYSAYFPNFSSGYSNDISFKYVLQRNSINSPIYPQDGSRLTLSAKSSVPYSMFNKQDFTSASSTQDKYKYLEYYKLKFTGEYYLPLTKDKKLVLSPRFGFGIMGGYNASKGLTPFERFVLGGSGLSGMTSFAGREIIALRGYDDNELSSSGGDPVIAKYTMELRYPISLNPQATIFALAFVEAGNTYTSVRNFNPFNVKRAVGGGVRIFLPMFGMLGLDYGWGFDALDPHSSGVTGSQNINRITNGYAGKFTFTIGMNLGEL